MQDHRLRFQKLDSYLVAREIAQLVHLAKIRDSELRDQATRASKSCFLQLCEGLPNESPAMRRRYFIGSHASLHETVGAVDLASTLGMMSTEHANAIQALAVRLKVGIAYAGRANGNDVVFYRRRVVRGRLGWRLVALGMGDLIPGPSDGARESDGEAARVDDLPASLPNLRRG